MTHTPESLKAFEQKVANAFNAGLIRAPVHLDGGNEEPLIEIFRDIRPQDYVVGSWRQHYHCLLKGVPEDLLMYEIMQGRSITLNFPQYRILSSAIVGGSIPIAVGLGWQIKRMNRDERVWAFCGDMTKRTGIYHECVQYARGHGLPVTFVCEDNGKSVLTDTKESWGTQDGNKELEYSYHLEWPHAGSGVRVQF